MRRTTTVKKIAPSSSSINSPEGANSVRPITKTEKSFNAQKGTSAIGSSNALLDKRRQTLGSPSTSDLRKSESKKSESRSSGFKISGPASITNSSNQAPLKFHSSHKPNNSTTFSNAK